MNDRLNAFAARLKQAVQQNGGNKAVAEASGVPLSTLNTYVAGTADPKLTVVARIAEVLGLSVDALLGSGTYAGPSGLQISEGIVLIPKLNVLASAGSGASNDSVEVDGVLPFAKDLLKQLGVRPSEAHFITARGDSMEPTIFDGAVVLVDTSIRRVRDDGVYALVVDGDVRLKRVQKSVGGSLTLISDNPKYPPEVVRSPDTLKVEGKVFWTGSGL